MTVFVDARTHSISRLIELALDAGERQIYLVICGPARIVTADLIKITSAGRGYVSFQVEAPPNS